MERRNRDVLCRLSFVASPTTQVLCAGCGGPLTPDSLPRVTCRFCGTVNDLASPKAVAIGQKLEKLGIRVPSHGMSSEEIAADIASREAERRAKLRTARILALVISIVFCLVMALVLKLMG